MSIYIEDMTFAYNNKEILHNINLKVDTGEIIGITGESGCGKSTLLKLLSGLYRPDTGIVEVYGQRIASEIMRKVAMVTQSAMLFPASIKENIACSGNADNAAIENALKAALLTDWVKTLPDGADTFVGERGGAVSGGQAQRIAVARAVYKNAPVFLLDEVTSHLDGDMGRELMEAILNLSKGKTVVIVSHRPEALIDCNRIFSVLGGQIHEK